MSKSNNGMLKLPIDHSLYAVEPIVLAPINRFQWLGIIGSRPNLSSLVAELIKGYYND